MAATTGGASASPTRRRRISKPYVDERQPRHMRWCITVREGALVRVFAGKDREEARRLAGLRPRKEGR